MTNWRYILAHCYSISLHIALPFVHAISLFSSNLRSQISQRSILATVNSQKSSNQNVIVVFCSSAGEYEQALPIIQRLQGHCFVHIFFFSRSGYDFAIKRQETLSYSLTPFDTISHWRKIFKILNPSAFIVVRHELWPGFLHTAASLGPIYLVNANPIKNPRLVTLKKYLYSYFHHIFAINSEAKDSLIKQLQFEPKKITITGDTKYDRATDRKSLEKKSAEEISNWIMKVTSRPKRLVAGSIYSEDLNLLLPAFLKLGDKSDWCLVIAPHFIDATNIEKIQTLIDSFGLKSVINPQENVGDPDVIIVARLGILAELYCVGNIAWVGGGVHHKVHNVLEPLAYNLPTAFGPQFQNSEEAVTLHKMNVVKSCNTSDAIMAWWQSAPASQKEVEPFFTKKFTGAAQKITNVLMNWHKL